MSKPTIIVDAQYLRKQRLAIEAITLENQRLKEELVLENKFSVNPTTLTATALIAHLKCKAEDSELHIIEQQRRRAQLDARITELKETIGSLRTQMGGVNSAAEKSIRAQRLVVLLENRLQHANTRRSQALLERTNLQSAINGLRRERGLFIELTQKTEKGIQKKAKEAAAVLNLAADIHGERVKAGIMKSQVKAHAERDVASYETEWQRLTDIIEADRKEREERRQREQKEREERLAALFKNDYVAPLKQQRRRGNNNHLGDDNTSDNPERPEAPSPTPLQEKIKRIQDQLETVKHALEVDGAEELTVKLTGARAENLRLFGQVNEAHSRVESLENTTMSLRIELDHLLGRSHEAIAAAALAATKIAELHAARDDAEAWESKADTATTRLEEIYNAADALYHKLCTSIITTSTSNPRSENNNNKKTMLLECVGFIEQRSNEMIQQYLALAASDQRVAAERAVKVLGNFKGTLPVEYAVTAPSMLTEVVAPAVYDQYLTREELKERSINAVASAVEDKVRVKNQPQPQ